MKTYSDILLRLNPEPHPWMVVRVGSHVYGTATEESDEDFVVVGGSTALLLGRGMDINVMSLSDFEAALANQSIYALEALFAPASAQLLPATRTFKYVLDRAALIASAKEKSESDFTKAIKTWGASEKAAKRLWHSLRIPMFAQQILTHGRIVDFTVANDYFEDILTDPNTDASYFASKWGVVRNSLLWNLR